MDTPREFAFWRYDLPPYVLGGVVVKKFDNGTCSIEGYSGYAYRPFLILPEAEGRRKYEQIQQATDAYQQAIRDAKTLLNSTVESILGMPIPPGQKNG